MTDDDHSRATAVPSRPEVAARRVPDATARWVPEAADAIRVALEDFVAAGGAPGAVAVLGERDQDDVRSETVAVGLLGAESGSAPATASTRYDVASVTKMLAVWPLTGIAVREHGLDPDSPVGRYLALPGPAERWPSAQVTTRQVLAHVSGLMRRTRLDLYRDRPGPVVERICAEPLERATGEYRYLSRGYILLGLLLGQLFGQDLDQLAAELVWRPAGMTATTYGPVPRGSAVAPTERLFPDAPRMWGQAHDDAARLLGGVAGHAGVFSSGADLAAYAAWLLSPDCPLADWLTESLRPRVAVVPTEPDAEGGPVGTGLRRGLGWMLTDTGVAYHDGFTGPSLYLRPEVGGNGSDEDSSGGHGGGRFLALCTNAVYAGRARPGLRKLRRAALDVVEAQDGSGG